LLSAQTHVRTCGLIDRFAQFVTTGHGIVPLCEVSGNQVAAFVAAPNARDGRRPSVATMRLRRWSVRLLFRVARDLELTILDPTQDVELPGRTNRSLRPLSDEEVARCRRAALQDLVGTRLAVMWALGEATARTSEIPHVRVRDIDLVRGRVWIRGGRQATSRWGALTMWGCLQLRRRLAELGDRANPDALIAGTGRGARESRVSFSAQGLREILTRAGLATEARVGPASVAGWAGVQVFAATGRIEVVAMAMGVRSMDAAARLIDWDWRTKAEYDDRAD
jgi:integrase